MTKKLVAEKTEWAMVSKELEEENIKVAYYDHILIPLLGNVKEKHILDYGAGPGMLAAALKKLGAEVKAWDISAEMRKLTGDKIGSRNVYNELTDIPNNYFDTIICNLVLCINPEKEVKVIVRNIKDALKKGGRAFIGFCNPLIFNVPESRIDIRMQTGKKYDENHQYKKIKKEGKYTIIEDHRPIEWYETVYQEAGLQVVKKHFTPEYRFKKKTIKDFIIFELRK
ncbi:methyltransferase domain-containing protein [Candidatus Woesearchaeota archaeon]|nr:methyltransferase domain-containing protein [Candidatus Woesearchaeota archaeon]